MPKCKINGQEVEVEAGTTIIEAFKKLDSEIAHYCYHPGLSVAGVCRLCMVEIEGNPRLQIACNTVVQDGMVINNNSEKVKETVKWGLDFHLINHPLDCPICDQAGECELQIQYMKFGQYDPEMAEPKVKKNKVVDLGSKIVLDSERCILCSRCVRFTEEVSKTNELGIFNRGDRSEIGTFDGKPLENDYAVNTVDICPVGALTSKDFRFRQRVWYLKNKETVCPGCSTGCNVKSYYNEEGLFRVKPRQNDEVNGYWMCDKGRDTYKFVNKENRLLEPKVGQSGQWDSQEVDGVMSVMSTKIDDAVKSAGSDKVALVLTGQYTSEEYASMLSYFVGHLKSKNVYHWVNNPESFDEFDGLLLRGDRNPNTKGLLNGLDQHGITAPWSDLETKLNAGDIEVLLVAGPEDPSVFPTLTEKVSLFSKAKNLFWMSAAKTEAADSATTKTWQIPLKTYAEKEGTFVNHKGIEQKIQPMVNIVDCAQTLSEVASALSGQKVDHLGSLVKDRKTNHFINHHGGGL
tara:strand:- start:15446 stop:16999 length:1554 start_codon:yes stop_codon:yes gene_type:complete